MAHSAEVISLPGTQAERIAATGVLHDVPGYTGTGRHDVVNGLVGGKVGKAPLARYRLPEALREHVLIAPAATDDDGLAMLPMLAKLADRVCPWVAVHIVPRILRAQAADSDFGRALGYYEVEGRRYSTAGGSACYSHNLVLLQSGGPVWMSHFLCHELMHIMWRNHLSQDARDVLEKAVSGGMEWPGGYYGSVEERVARLFEAWCWAWLEGQPDRAVDFSELSVDSVFAEIWTGRLADQQIRDGLVPDAERLRARRGLTAPVTTAPAARHWLDAAVDAGFTVPERAAAAVWRMAVGGCRTAVAAFV